MIVAVNTRFLLDDHLEGYGNFIYECFSRIAAQHPEHQFIYIFDRPFNEKYITSKNITPAITGPQARHPLLWRLWYNYKVPAILRKYKADIFVSPDGFCSLRTKVPQCLVVHDLAFLYYPDFIKKSHLRFYKRYTPKFLKKAKSVATVSEYSKQDIISRYKIDTHKIDVVYSGVKDIFKPLGYEEKDIIKEKYTQGKEYFLYVGAIHPRKNLMNILKAFSHFKKWQKSNMQLVIAGRLGWMYDKFTHDLKTYKYRDEVVMAGYLPQEELVKVVASAYAMVYPSFFEGFGVPPLEAMKCNVPSIAANVSAMPEIYGDAALYADANDFKNIAAQMQLIYKDETRRNELIKKGQEQVKKYTWKSTADLLWQGILKAKG